MYRYFVIQHVLVLVKRNAKSTVHSNNVPDICVHSALCQEFGKEPQTFGHIMYTTVNQWFINPMKHGYKESKIMYKWSAGRQTPNVLVELVEVVVLLV